MSTPSATMITATELQHAAIVDSITLTREGRAAIEDGTINGRKARRAAVELAEASNVRPAARAGRLAATIRRHNAITAARYSEPLPEDSTARVMLLARTGRITAAVIASLHVPADLVRGPDALAYPDRRALALAIADLLHPH